MNRPNHDPLLRLTRLLVWVFALSWAFDFKADLADGSAGGSLLQGLFLAVSVGSAAGVVVLNWSYLPARPVGGLVVLWGAFLAYAVVQAGLLGVPPGRFLRVALPYLLLGLGLVISHLASCRGVRPSQIVAPLVVAGCLNVLWRIFHGFAFKGATLETVRLEVFSPAMNPLIAFLGCAILLRPRLHWSVWVVGLVTLTGVLVSVTRALLFPMAVAGLAGGLCLLLGMRWRIFQRAQLWRKTLTAASAGAALLVLLGILQLAVPLLVERWTGRLFHSARSTTTTDISWVTREAEAAGMWKSLEADPVFFLTGKGMGGEYFWDPAYWPELYTVFPRDYNFSEPIWFNGHSVWTYTLFSTGGVGVLCHVAFFCAVVVVALRVVRGQAAAADPEAWLGFLPVLMVFCLLSESVTSNQLAERLTGVMLGMAAGAPQALVRSALQRRRWLGAVRSLPAGARVLPLPEKDYRHA